MYKKLFSVFFSLMLLSVSLVVAQPAPPNAAYTGEGEGKMIGEMGGEDMTQIQTQSQIQRDWAKNFKIIGFFEGAVNQIQDAVILKPLAASSRQS